MTSGTTNTLTAPEPPFRTWRFDRARRDRYLTALRNGLRPMKAARAAGVSWSTIRDHRDRDPYFAAAEREALDEALEEVEDALYTAAVSGQVTAAIFVLTNRAPDRWADKRATPTKVEITGQVHHDHDGTIQVEVGPDADLARIRAALAEAQAEHDRLMGAHLPTPALPTAHVVDTTATEAP
jgi:hypothetical protein